MYSFNPEILHRPRRRRKPPQMPMWQALKEGGPAARAHAGRQMLARRAGLASWEEQRHSDCPNLKAAWKGLAAYWRRWHHERDLPADKAEADLQARRREVDIWSNGVVG
jgi:hypothetical protein